LSIAPVTAAAGTGGFTQDTLIASRMPLEALPGKAVAAGVVDDRRRDAGGVLLAATPIAQSTDPGRPRLTWVLPPVGFGTS
jgi:hypothetical protein